MNYYNVLLHLNFTVVHYYKSFTGVKENLIQEVVIYMYIE